jgi:uridine phosphorylase
MSDGREPEGRARKASGRQYHVDLAPGEVAPFVMLVGDPARAQLVADMFDRVDLERRNREFVTFTGMHRGLRLSVMGTGIGPDNMEIAVIELCACTEKPTFIRCGTCGALQPEIQIGDLVVSQAAYRLENTSLHFVGEGYPAVAHPEVVLALIQAADEAGFAHHVGITATAPGFYGAQGRSVSGFAPRNPDIVADLQRQGVKNMEMEISSLLTLSSIRGCRAGAVCVAFAARPQGSFIDPGEKRAAEKRCVETGISAFHNVARIDRLRGTRPYWHPGLA